MENIILPEINTQNSLKWEYIIIHHSETSAHTIQTWNGIKAYHMSWRYNDDIVTEEKAKELIAQGKTVLPPDRDIAYNFGVQSDDNLTNFKYLIGRPLSISGAHCLGFNAKGIGICSLENWDMHMPTHETYDAIAVLVNKLINVFNISIENVIGHRESYDLLNVPRKKQCPGSNFDMVYLRRLIRSNIVDQFNV